MDDWAAWWEPERPKHRVPGDLHFDARGARVILRDSLPEHHAFRVPTLFGETFEGTRYTLVDPVVEKWEHRGGPEVLWSRISLHSRALLRGYHAPDLWQLPISTAIVRFTGIRELSLHPWHGEDPFLADPFDARQLDMPNGTLLFGRTQDTEKGPGGFTESHERDVAVRITTTEPLPVPDFDDEWVRPLEGLVVLAARGPTLLKQFTLMIDDPDGTTTEAELLTEAQALTSKIPDVYDRPLLPFAALGDGAAETFAAWWDLYGRLARAARILVGTLSSDMFVETQLGNLVSVAESYHRIFHNEPPIAPEQHKANVESMLASIEDTAQREHYRNRLGYAAEQTARQRLRWLIRRASDALQRVERLDDRLAGELVTTRNAYAHLDPEGQQGVDGRDLVYATARLQLVLQTNILFDLGIPAQKAAELVLTSYLNQMPVLDLADD